MNNPRRLETVKALMVLAAAWSLLLPTLLQPEINLRSAFSTWVCRLTNTGSVLGATVIACCLVFLTVFRAKAAWRSSAREALVHVVVLSLLLAGGASLNEYVIKPGLAVHRPNIVLLAEERVLEMTSEQFYASMDKQERRDHLRRVLMDSDAGIRSLSPQVREHWIHEAGYSLPSGHAFAAMMLAAYFLLASRARKRRHHCAYWLLPWWGVAIGWSRVLLQVHRPVDVILGGLMGIVFGGVGVWLSLRLLRRFHRVSAREGS